MRARIRGFAVLALVVAALLNALPLVAQTVFRNPEYEYVVDIPVGWGVLEAESLDAISFSDPDRVGVFQVLAFPGNRFATVEEIDRFIQGSFNARGETVPFDYNGAPAIFADYAFTAGRIPVRGYMVFVNQSDFDFAIMTFAVVDHYEPLHDVLLSALDSFSPNVATRLRSGPVSQFFHAVERPADPAEALLVLPSGATMPLPRQVGDPGVVDAAQVVIEREARLLVGFAPARGESTQVDNARPAPWGVAWRRYFRMVFRDSFERLEPVADALFHDLSAAGVKHEEFPAQILSWLQDARYERTNTLSDLAGPPQCLVDFAGDCDSLGLTYAILLQHLGFDAVLMVSIMYSHAMVGVDLPGTGARFSFEGREWLVAEMTAKVALGMIDQQMADPIGWLGVKLDPTAQW